MNSSYLVDKIQIGSTQMRYMKFGSGERTMVIIPGLNVIPVTAQTELKAEEYAMFAKDYTVYIFDVKDDVPEDYSLAQMAEDDVYAIKSLGLKDIYLFGTSMGGMKCMYIAGTYPELVKKVAIGSSECKAEELIDKNIHKWIDLAKSGDGLAFMEDQINSCCSEKSKKENWVEMVAPGKDLTKESLERFCRIARCIIGFDFTKEAASIRCPAILIGSEGDRIMTREYMEETANIIGCPSYFYGRQYGHIVYDETPDFQKRLYDFFRQ